MYNITPNVNNTIRQTSARNINYLPPAQTTNPHTPQTQNPTRTPAQTRISNTTKHHILQILSPARNINQEHHILQTITPQPSTPIKHAGSVYFKTSRI
jgi:hypothetical protein